MAEAIKKMDPAAKVRRVRCGRIKNGRVVCEAGWETKGGSQCSGSFDVYMTGGGEINDSESGGTGMCTLASSGSTVTSSD